MEKIAVRKMDERARHILASSCLSFLETIGTATGRATKYNTKKEQEAALSHIFEEMFGIDRGLAQIALTLSGVMDHAIQRSCV